VKVRELTDADADQIATWRYPDRYSTYDVNETFTPDRGFWAVEHESELVGYCCFGYEARVPGIEEQEGTLDIGYGMRPDLVGQGLGPQFVTAILDFAADEFSFERQRMVILDWNERSRRLAQKLGFEERGTVPSAEGVFVIVERSP
jgi:RimJ/RimL family protein N-acetyltransferase